MAITVDGELPAGVTAKDVVLAIIARIGTGGGIGSVIEYRGTAIRALSMEGRMTVCNMSIEAGARAGLDRARRHDVRVPRRPAARAEGRGVGARARRLARARHRRRRARSTRKSCIDAATLRPARVVGHEPEPDVTIDDARPRSRRVRRRVGARVGEARARATWV